MEINCAKCGTKRLVGYFPVLCGRGTLRICTFCLKGNPALVTQSHSDSMFFNEDDSAKDGIPDGYELIESSNLKRLRLESHRGIALKAALNTVLKMLLPPVDGEGDPY